MEKEKMQEILKKFKSKDEMRQYIFDNSRNLQVSEANRILKTLSKAEEGEYSFADVIAKGAKQGGIPKTKNAELYQDVIEDLETQRGVAEFSGDTKLAQRLQEEKFDVLESAEKEDIGIYLKKYYPRGYNLLAKSLNALEKDEHTCYNGCIHKLLTEKNLSTIVRTLENLAQVDPEVNSFVDSNLDVNKSLKIPTINGMPLGGYGIVGDGMRNIAGKIGKFFGIGKKTDNEKYNSNSDDQEFYKSSNSQKQNDTNFYRSVENGESNDYDFNQNAINNVRSTGAIKNENSFIDNIKSAIGAGYDGINNIGESIASKAREETANTIDYWTRNATGGFGEFAKNIAEDLRNYDPDNTDMQKIKDSNYFSGYKGVPIVKNDMQKKIGIWGSFCLGDVIALERESVSSPNFENTVRHEYGHSIQYDNLGPLGYYISVAFPSALNHKSASAKGEEYYYSQPGENSADTLGGVKRKFENNKNVAVGESYNIRSSAAWLNYLKKTIDSWN